MNTRQVMTRTATRVLTDEVRASPVDHYLERRQWWLLWGLVFVVILILII